MSADDVVSALDDLLDDDIPVVSRSGKQAAAGGQFVASKSVGAQLVVPSAAAGTPSDSDATITPTRPDEPPDVQVADDEKEISEILEQAATVAASPVSADPFEQRLSELVTQAASAAGLNLDGAEIRGRFRDAVNAYARDVRDALETTSKFTMPTASGGLGMTDEQADRAMAALQSKVSEFRSELQAKSVQEKKKFVEAEVGRMMKAQEQEQVQERRALDRLYTKLTGKEVADAGEGAEAGEVGRIVTPVAVEPKVIPVVAVKKEPVQLPTEPVAVPSAVAAPPPEPSPASVMAPVVAAPSKQLQNLEGGGPEVAPAPPSKPLVSDVVAASPKLTGPVEEIGSMTLRDFRRLSKDPKEATLKLRDKLDLIEDQESFEKKTMGINAWRESPVNRIYLDILKQSLEGKPVIEVIAAAEAAGKETLTKSEFDAVMQFNRKLRFG